MEDNDCDGKVGCADSDCASTAVCTRVPTGLAFVTNSVPVTTGACSQALTVELRDVTSAPAVAPAAATIDLSAAPPAGVTLYSDAACTQQVSQITVPQGQSQSWFLLIGAAT